MHGGAFLIGIILLFFALWLVGGGPNRPISFQGPYLTPITTTGDTADAYGGERQARSPGLLGDLLGDGGTQISTGNASAQRGSVTLERSTSGARASDPEEEYVTIRLSSSAQSGVSVTGWQLKSEVSGASLIIPSGVEVLRMGSVNQASAIMLAPGEDAVITTGRSPAGSSFQENICTGYLDQFQAYTPSLESSCPVPLAEFDDYFENEGDEECENFVRSIDYCSTDVDMPSEVSSTCERFVEERLTYTGCVRAHEKDADFSIPVWRVFAGGRTTLWGDDRDVIQLIDASGKIVDVLSY